ncbi:peptide ABC transporter substrate-binding protein [Vagococcus sp. DIV0080]|uniref:Peptide ABC transporter substrate-binding protein n=1 Tax=Candidatus Vagococcus giribetii TaxID=2230876 RepID=A0ABS3HQ86_9ENTE|nr:peptide ABC transporter substrate-binding protein [Vagococcus sp. DIV0080]MBO0475905.1 peptide ABC transporter substrate-binding protein [Vagococcus sp. DIV0080]
MKKKQYLKLGIVIMGTLLLASCGNKDDGKKEKAKESAATATRTINLMEQTEIGSLDTIFTQDEASVNLQANVFEGLYQLDGKDNILPAIAKELPEISEDGKTYTIKLREDSKWTNGDPVTAHDFVFAWRKMANPANQANYFFLLDGTVENGTAIINDEKKPEELGIEAKDDYTLEIRLEKPVAYFTSMLTFTPFFPQNEKYVEEKGKAYGTSSDNIVSNGAYIIKDWNQASMSWNLEKNPDYYDVKEVKNDKLHFEVIKESNTAYNLFESGELDMATISGDLAVNNKENPNFEAVQTSKIYYLKLNQLRNGKPTLFANENVRKAIAYGLDKEALADQIVADGSKAIYGYVPYGFVSNPESGVDYREEAGDVAKTDAKKATEYLEKAKKELNGEVKMEFLSKDGDSDKRIAEYIQGQLEESLPGLKLDIKTVPQQNSIELTKKGDYELAMGTWAPDYQDPTSFLGNLITGNNSAYSNPKFDELMADAANKYGNDPVKRWQTLMQAEKVMVEDDAAIVPLFQQYRGQLVNDKLSGITRHLFGSTMTYKTLIIEE